VAIPDVITRKKLILVKQLYQRAVLQADAQHSPVDRIMAVISFDLTHETVLKAVVGSLTSKPVKNEFQEVLQQADSLLLAAGLPEVPDKARIQYVRNIRNDAQHKARYPGPIEVSDSRTYSRDFLKQVILNVWNENFELISLVDAIQNDRVKGYLREAEEELARGNYSESIIKTIAGFGWTMSNIRDSIIGRMPYRASSIVISDGTKQTESRDMLESYKNMQETLMRSVIGLSFAGYLRYKQITRSVGNVIFMQDGGYTAGLHGYDPDVKEAEYVVEFGINAVLQIEDLVGDINKPFTL